MPRIPFGCLLWLTPIFALMLLVPATGSAQEAVASPPGEDAGDLYAQGLGAELDGDIERALELMRRAHDLAPTDALIAFDLARVAYDRKGPGWEEDVQGLLALESADAAGPDASILRAYLLLERGQRTAASREVAAVLSADPAHGEALELRSLLGPLADSEKELAVAARVRAGIEVDSNVAVAPDFVASGQFGTRAAADGAVLLTWRPPRTRVEAGGLFSLSAHLNDRQDLAFYDASTLTLFGGATYLAESFSVGLTLIGSEVFIEGFGAHFMQEVGGRLNFDLPIGPVVVGAYVDGAHRDFVAGNLEDRPSDRDGPRGRGGVAASAGFGDFAFSARVGGQLEAADQRLFKEAGLDSAVAVTWRWESLAITGGMKYDYRNYHRTTREDHRLTPHLKAGWAFTDQLGVALNGVLMRNISNDPNYDYTRVIVSLGGEATF